MESGPVLKASSLKISEEKDVKETTKPPSTKVKPFNQANSKLILNSLKSNSKENSDSIVLPFGEAMLYSALTKYYSQRSVYYLNIISNNDRNSKIDLKYIPNTKFPKRFYPLINQIRSYYQSKMDLLTPGKAIVTDHKRKDKAVAKAHIVGEPGTAYQQCLTCMSTYKTCALCIVRSSSVCC